MNEEHFDVIVIGGGASGMMAAGLLGERGLSVLLLEKNAELGAKLSITGGGRCNITNAEYDVRAFLAHFSESKEFLYSPFAQFGIADTFAFFERIGVPIVIQEHKRAFPKSEHAKDVTRALTQFLTKNNVTVRLRTPVGGMIRRDNRICGVATPSRKCEAPYYILATGGYAAPETGSTGDGFRFLESLHHTITPPSPAIVPLTTSAKWVRALSGTKHDATIRFYQNNKMQLKQSGSILCTHFGISGPVILNCASEVLKLKKVGAVSASIDWLPNMDTPELDARLIALFSLHPKMQAKNALKTLLPARIAHSSAEILADRSVNTITRDERMLLISRIKDRRFPITGARNFTDAVIADGGLPLTEVNMRTMASLQYENLYVLGDILHINRPSGGYSLQLAWTTAFVAANAIANRVSDKNTAQSPK